MNSSFSIIMNEILNYKKECESMKYVSFWLLVLKIKIANLLIKKIIECTENGL